MANFSCRVGRRTVYWTDHALERWWERCDANELNGHRAALELLRERLEGSRIKRDLPTWSRVTLYHRARAEGFVAIDEDSGFIVNRNPNGDYVAVTYIEREKAFA